MKQSIILIILILSLSLLSAQEINLWQNFRHSSVDASGRIHIRWDNLVSQVPNVEFYAKRGSDVWQSWDVNLLPDGSSEALPPFSWNVPLNYRLRSEQTVEGVGMAVMHPAWLSENSFPQILGDLALIGHDAFGDSITIYNPVLDLGDTWMGCSDEKLFFAMQNSSGSFPTMNSFTSYNAWGCVIANPEAALSDSTVYAMVYANVLGLLSPGLYKLGLEDGLTPSFDRLADIQSVVSDGKLYLVCNISDFTSDPSFGAWPNFSNALALSALSMRVNINLSTMEPDIGLGDYSMPGVVIFEKLQHMAANNTQPQVSNLTADGQSVSFRYQDAEGDFPLVCEFVDQDGNVLQMQNSEHDYIGGVVFSARSDAEILSGSLLVSDNNIQYQTIELEPASIQDEYIKPQPFSCILPNPIARGSSINISLKDLQPEELSLQIYNIRGQKLWSFTGYPYSTKELLISWDAQFKGKHAPAGIYLLKAKQAKCEQIKKFSIIR